MENIQFSTEKQFFYGFESTEQLIEFLNKSPERTAYLYRVQNMKEEYEKKPFPSQALIFIEDYIEYYDEMFLCNTEAGFTSLLREELKGGRFDLVSKLSGMHSEFMQKIQAKKPFEHTFIHFDASDMPIEFVNVQFPSLAFEFGFQIVVK